MKVFENISRELPLAYFPRHCVLVLSLVDVSMCAFYYCRALELFSLACVLCIIILYYLDYLTVVWIQLSSSDKIYVFMIEKV